MKYTLLLLIVMAAIIVACNKDKFKTEPQIEVKSISPKTVFRGNVITLKAKFTDDEGDIDTILLVYKWYNGAIIVRPPEGDTLRFPFDRTNVPPKTREGEMEVTYNYYLTTPPYLTGATRDTTATLGLILKDKAGHRSNYSESEKIRLKAQ